MIIGVDIDGTLTNEKEGHDYKKRTPNKKGIEWVNTMYKDNTIVLHTARYIEDRTVTVRWLRKHKAKYHQIIFGKPRFDMYVGDEVKHPSELF